MTPDQCDRWVAEGNALAARGLRVLMVAQGAASTDLERPSDLTALGFVGIEDPLRPGVQAVLKRCRDAGVRVIMLTGDHPETARSIAKQAGLIVDGEPIVTGPEIAELQNGELADRLEQASVIARVTPLDKLRIVETLQSRGHAVAMTGDGVNDAPALRLADVGVAMGRGGTEVARQAADVILADDNFSTLVEALVEGRSFWRNVRRAIGLLLGGNVGELSLMAGSSLVGLPSPLGTRQILAMNLITDAIPALAVALQEPEHRNLAELSREGVDSLDTPLKKDVFRRGIATLGPSLAAYILMLPAGLPTAQTVAFATAVTTQLAQTVDAGRAQVGLTPPVIGAALASGGLMFAALLIPSLRAILGLTPIGAYGWILVALLGGFGSVAIGRATDSRLRTNGRFLPARYIPPPKPLPLSA